MKLSKLPPQPTLLMDFFEEGIEALGGTCERVWHDRLEIVAEGAAARLWRADGRLHTAEVQFPNPEAAGARDAERQAFPGCPLTFRLTEELWRPGHDYQRLVLATDFPKPPEPTVASKIWQQQLGDTPLWRMQTWRREWHFSIVGTVRCEIQAIEQTWSCHRMAFGLPRGDRDADLENDLAYFTGERSMAAKPPWPEALPGAWMDWIIAGLTNDLHDEIEHVNHRQREYLRRELERIDQYFGSYVAELSARMKKQGKEEARKRMHERLRATEAERIRRREDQVQRHGICVLPHVDNLLWTAEPSWATTVEWRQGRDTLVAPAVFLPRARQWFVKRTADT